MVASGVEMIIGVVHDPQFGPLLACGAGGVTVEIQRDIAVQLTPVDRRSAGELLRSLKTYPLLTRFRGARPCDVAALEDAIERISAMTEDFPQIAEMDCNPVIVHEHGISIVDARVRISTDGSIATHKSADSLATAAHGSQ
jgi:acyl-CoA synthetase (NDP forming)